MTLAQLPLIAELDAGDSKIGPKATSAKFSGTSNVRHLRVLHALLNRSLPREHLDRVAGASNGPELVAELRRRGLTLPCSRVPSYDRDGLLVRIGVYSLTESDRRKVSKWLRKQKEMQPRCSDSAS